MSSSVRSSTSPSDSSVARTVAAGRTELWLYVTLVVVWGSSWIAIHHQLGVVAPEVSLVWRFALSAAICFAIGLVKGERLAFDLAVHARFAVLGLLLFSSNFLLFYHAGAFVPSGLLAVVFALASPINLGLGALFFGRPIDARTLLGAGVGVAGVALLYAPQIAAAGFDRGAALGLALCVAGTLCFCLGNMLSGRVQAESSDLAATAWGMLYGTGWLALVAVVSGAEFTIETTFDYLASLIWLAAGSSVAAFLAYLALMKRVGPGRAGFATVLFPVVALALSSLFEDYHWGLSALIGVALVAAGNVIVLGLARRKA